MATPPPPDNPVPDRLARVVDADDVGEPVWIGRPSARTAFVTAAEDIEGLSAAKLSTRLGIPSAERFWVVEFPASALEGGLASPLLHSSQCFIGGGRTRGGAREFVVPNQPIPSESSRRLVT